MGEDLRSGRCESLDQNDGHLAGNDETRFVID